MLNDRLMKSISEGSCPHCNHPIMISTQFTAPIVDWILKPEDLNMVKDKMKIEIDKIKFKTEKEKTEVLSWLDKETIGPDEVDMVLTQIIEKHVKSK